jgi:hypothetical protein
LERGVSIFKNFSPSGWREVKKIGGKGWEWYYSEGSPNYSRRREGWGEHRGRRVKKGGKFPSKIEVFLKIY